MTTTHPRFTVRVAAHEANDPTWRIQHASETIEIVAAYFRRDDNGVPIRNADGTFEVHAPSRTTLPTLRQMLTDHEGLTIIGEGRAPGNGILTTKP